MSFVDLITLEKEEVLELVQTMLTRPMMYAQNPGSLEDQTLALLELIWSRSNQNQSVHHEYLKFTRSYFKNDRIITTASRIKEQIFKEDPMLSFAETEEETLKELSVFFKEFVKHLETV